MENHETALGFVEKEMHMDLCANLSFTSTFEMPKVAACGPDAVGNLVAFSRKRHFMNKNSTLHFYIHDQKFHALWTNPDRYTAMFKQVRSIIAPDFSVYTDMPMAQVVWNTYRNKMLAAYWQSEGIPVIPNASWATESTYEYCFDGLPSRSVIAINSTGIGTDTMSRKLWRQGYDYALQRLDHILIVRYGAKQAGEKESISLYFENENFKATHHGR